MDELATVNNENIEHNLVENQNPDEVKINTEFFIISLNFNL
jgi:hypothetical protein